MAVGRIAQHAHLTKPATRLKYGQRRAESKKPTAQKNDDDGNVNVYGDGDAH